MNFVPRDHVTIYLKSGVTFDLMCDKAYLYYDEDTGKLRKYLFMGMKKPDNLYIDLDSIAIIMVNTLQVKA